MEIFRKINHCVILMKKKELFKMLMSKYSKIIKIDKKIFFNKLDKIKILSENSILIFYSYKE